MATDEKNTLKSSKKIFRLIELLLEKDEAGVTELANETTFHKSTVYMHLQTLKEEGFITKSGTKYRLSLDFLNISEGIKRQRSVYQQGKNEIDGLAQDIGELVFLSIPEDGQAVVIHSARGEKAVQSMPNGTKISLQDNAIGNVLQAYSQDLTANEAESENERTSSSNTFQSLENEKSKTFSRIRADGYQVTEDEGRDGALYVAEPDYGGLRSDSHRTGITYRTIAAPVLVDRTPAAAVAVTGSANRINNEYQDTLRKEVVRTAATIERKLSVNQ